MTVVDTSVVVAAFASWHEQHKDADDMVTIGVRVVAHCAIDVTEVQVPARFAFEDLHANRVEIRMDARNTRSRAVPERLGFIYEGCLRRAIADVDGQAQDTVVFALIGEDYARLGWRTSRT